MKVTATKEFTFDFAHMLEGHEGLCKNIHGHSYVLQVTVSRHNTQTCMAGPAAGMVIDFKHLKEIVKECIVDKYDHSFVFNKNSNDQCELEVARTLQTFGKKVVELKYRPTAENMTIDWFHQLDDMLEGRCPEVILEKVRLYETATSYAEFGK